MKLKQMRMQKGIQQKELAARIGVDEPTLSKFENYKCLPTPDVMERILDALGCGLSDIYSREEVTFRDPVKTSDPRVQKLPTHYTVSARMPAAVKDYLQVALKACGYSSITEWLTQCTEDLRARYEAVQKQKETPSAAGKLTDEAIKEETETASSTELYHKKAAVSRGEVKKVGNSRIDR